jgi:hypothetical protein
MYTNYNPQTPRVYQVFFADDTFMYATDRSVIFPESCSAVSIQLRRGVRTGTLKSIKVKLGPSYFSHRLTPPEVRLTLNGRNIPFVNDVKYLGVIFDKRITWRLHKEMIEVKAFRIFMRLFLIQ